MHTESHNGTFHVPMIGPHSKDGPVYENHQIQISLERVKYACDIRVSYDMDRCGYVISVPPPGEANACDGEWREAAFIDGDNNK